MKKIPNSADRNKFAKLALLACFLTLASCKNVGVQDYSKPFLYQNQTKPTKEEESAYTAAKANCNLKAYATCEPLVAKQVGAKLLWDSSSGVPATATTVVYVLLAPDGNVTRTYDPLLPFAPFASKGRYLSEAVV